MKVVSDVPRNYRVPTSLFRLQSTDYSSLYTPSCEENANFDFNTLTQSLLTIIADMPQPSEILSSLATALK